MQSLHAALCMLLRDELALVVQAVVEDLETPRSGVTGRDDGVGEAVDGEVGAEGAFEGEEAVRARPGSEARNGRIRRGSHWRRHEGGVGDLVQEDLRDESMFWLSVHK